MTRIGMALDSRPDRTRVRRRRFRLLLEVIIGVVALALLATNVFLVTQRDRTTEVAVDDLLAEVRDPAGGDPGTAPATPEDDASGQASAAAPTGDVSEPAGGDAGPSTAPSEEDAGAPETAADTSAQPSADAQPDRAGATADGEDEEADPAAQEPAPKPDDSSQAPAASTPAAGPVFSVPAEGVYSYRTEGYESVSMGGARHDYPDRSYAIVEHGDGCEWTWDHRVIEEHRDKSTLCTEGPQISNVRFDNHVTFFGQKNESHFECSGEGTHADLRDQPGDTHHGSCTDGNSTSDETETFVGRETLVVGGVEVEALRYHDEAEISGDTTGQSVQERWVHPETGLLLKMVRSTRSTAQAFGASEVHYEEEATFVLESLEPQR